MAWCPLRISVSALTYNYGAVSVASPFIMSMYNLVKIPVNNRTSNQIPSAWCFNCRTWFWFKKWFCSNCSASVIDTYARDEAFSSWEIVGAVCIGTGFFLIVLPDDRVSIRIKDRFCSFWIHDQKQVEERMRKNADKDVVPETALQVEEAQVNTTALWDACTSICR